MAEIPQSDCLERCTHPRTAETLIGHGRAERRLLEAYISGKMPHAWILSGEAGIGKATLAYRLARFMFKHPDISRIDPEGASLHVGPADPVFHRVSAQAHADLLIMRRAFNDKRGKLFTEIRAEDVRKSSRFFSTTSGEGGWRICIVDTADEMNLTAANALLKILEEPPRRALFLLISNTPHRLLPTIRSRCCNLAMSPLDVDGVRQVFENQIPAAERPSAADMAILTRLGQGSAGRALKLATSDGARIYRDIHKVMSALPGLDLAAAHILADDLTGRPRAAQFDLFFDLLGDWIAALVRSGLKRPSKEVLEGEGAIMQRLAPPEALAHWSALWEKVNHSLAQTRALNLDRKQLVLDTLFSLQETARKTA